MKYIFEDDRLTRSIALAKKRDPDHNQPFWKEVVEKQAALYTGHITRLVNGAGNLSPLERHMAVSVYVNGVWTNARLERAGLLQSPLCTKCDLGEVDTVPHRLYRCTHSKCVRDQLPTWILSNAARQGFSSAKYSRLCVVDPTKEINRPREEMVVVAADYTAGQWVERPNCDWSQFHFTVQSNAHIMATDGSGTSPKLPWRRASWAVVVVDAEDGHPVFALMGTVPRMWPQTAVFGEHVAFMMANDSFRAEPAGSTVTIAVDNQSVVDAYADGIASTIAAARPFSGVWLETGSHRAPFVRGGED